MSQAAALQLPSTKYELEYNHGSIYSDEERNAILSVFDRGAPSCGPEVLQFEAEFAAFCQVSNAIAVGNATQGLELAVRSVLKAASTTSNEHHSLLEVIVPSVSWMSTASSAAITGVTVRFADVVDPTVCVDPDSIKALVNDRTVAVIVVHLFGRPVDGLIELAAWLHDRNIYLIEDCAHAVGASYANGSLCGTVGDIGVFSFHQQKNMVTLGEGGMCITNNSKLHQLMVGFRSLCAMSYDPKGKYLAMNATEHPMGHRYWMMDFVDHGHNFRMVDIQAAVGRVQLRKVKGWNLRRAAIAKALFNGLHNIHPGLLVPADIDIAAEGDNDNGTTHSWHAFHVLVTDQFPLSKEAFMWALLDEFGIKAWNHYVPMHLSTSFRSCGMGKVGDCPVAEALFEQYVSLPIHPRLTEEAVQYMIDAIHQISTRPHVPRNQAAPLLTELLALTDPHNANAIQSESGSNSATIGTTNDIANSCGIDDSLIDNQWKLLKSLVYSAISDGLFIPSISSHVIDVKLDEVHHDYGDVDGDIRVHVARSPGRLDLMGGNDDYTGGLVFECTLAEATFVAAQRRLPHHHRKQQQKEQQALGREESLIVIRNQQLCSMDISIPVSILRQDGLTASELSSYLMHRFDNSRWQLYVVGTLYWLQKRYPQQMFKDGREGLSLLVWSEVPLNRGVSSSASVEVAVMKAAAHVFGIALSGELLATACQWVENEVCSSACGLMDQMAVTLGAPFMAMQCQPAVLRNAPSLPDDITIYAIDSGVSHEVSGIEYEAARVAAFMGYKIICDIEGLEVTIDSNSTEISRYTDAKYNGYLANLSPSVFARRYEHQLPISISGQEYLEQYGCHVDPATVVRSEHVYNVRANTKYAVYENNRVTLFYHLLNGCRRDGGPTQYEVYKQLGDLMYQSHDAYTECGLGSSATSRIVDIVQSLGPDSGLFGAKITGGGAGGTVCILGLCSAMKTFQEDVVEVYHRTYYATRCSSSSGPDGSGYPHVFVGSSIGADAFGIRYL